VCRRDRRGLFRHVLGLDLRDRLHLQIYPDMLTTRALDCSLAGYSPDSSIKGCANDMNAFITSVEDHIADFLAEIATTPTAALLVQSSAAARTVFDELTPY
jgi:hypothetical protein